MYLCSVRYFNNCKIMLKALFFNVAFIFSFSVVAIAAEEVYADTYGKEKPKGYTIGSKKEKLNQSFTLRSGMYFKGENIIDVPSEISKNSSFNWANNITFQKSQNSYVLPHKKKAILNKLTFNPNEVLRNYSAK